LAHEQGQVRQQPAARGQLLAYQQGQVRQQVRLLQAMPPAPRSTPQRKVDPCLGVYLGVAACKGPAARRAPPPAGPRRPQAMPPALPPQAPGSTSSAFANRA
jgi:hypothetical protein